MNQTGVFLGLYKELEGILRSQDRNLSILKYEEFLPQAEMEKLRVCRQMRNYIQHHEDGETFLICSEAMCDFIRALIKKEKEGRSSRIQEMIPVYTGDRLSEIQMLFSKNNRTWMPVSDNSGKYLGILEMLPLIRLTSRHNPNTRLLSVLPDAGLDRHTIPVLTNTEINDFEGSDAVIVDENGNYIGIAR